jgi:hypothetical protein
MQRMPAGEIDSPRRFSASKIAPDPGRAVDRRRHHLFDFDWRAVLQDWFAATDLLQGQLAAFVV